MNQKKVILLVEDNADDVDLTVYALKKNKFLNEVVVVRDGVEALDYLLGPDRNGREGPLPGLILLDLKLPKIDGLEVLQKLRDEESTRLIPVVVMTSSREDRDVNKAYSLGANSYVRKPVDFDRFVQSIRELLHYWLEINVLPEPGKGD